MLILLSSLSLQKILKLIFIGLVELQELENMELVLHFI